MNSYDCIIVGSGVAGLTAALALAPRARVLLLTKDKLDESATRYAQGGIAAAIGADDSAAAHERDTLEAGAGLVDEAAARTLTADAAARIADLVALGVPFDREDGAIALGREAAHSAARIVHAGGDATGYHLERTLVQRVLDAPLDLREHAVVTRIVVREGRVAGLDLLDTTTRRAERIEAPAVVLATGGAGQLYRYTTNPAVATGDGVALAYRAGAAVADMEFIQFHPTALRLPGAPATLVTEAVRGEGAILRDTTGYAFARDYDPRGELAPRDVVARAIWAQMAKTNAACVYLDLRGIDPARVRQRFPGLVATGRAHGFDPTVDLVPVAPAAHYTMGGIWTDSWGRTTLPGLYACGEAACTGVHGANRLASNSLLEGLVFGTRVARNLSPGPSPVRGGKLLRGDGRLKMERLGDRAALGTPLLAFPLSGGRDDGGAVAAEEDDAASPVRQGWLNNAASSSVRLSLPRGETGWSPQTLSMAAEAREGYQAAPLPATGAPTLPALQALMWDDAGLVRDAAGLEHARATLAAWEAALPAPSTRAEHELANLLLLGRMVVEAALLRHESRGAHYRRDFPEPSADGLHHTVFQAAPAEEFHHAAAD